jgi:hypothetical protein
MTKELMPKKSIEVIELTPKEAAFYAKIPREVSATDSRTWTPIASAMEKLMESLESRDAIPKIRRKVFFELAETGSKSTFDIFESNGTKGTDICRHGNFVKHLHYFINGPDLPTAVLDGFLEIINEDRGTSGMLMKELQKYVRKSVRDYGLVPSNAATNFWRLCQEVGYLHADTIRRAAMTAK